MANLVEGQMDFHWLGKVNFICRTNVIIVFNYHNICIKKHIM